MRLRELVNRLKFKHSSIQFILGFLTLGIPYPFTCSYVQAQTLARPGWAGSGIRSDPWWKHAVMCDLASSNAPLDPDELSGRLQALHILGVDAVMVQAPRIELDPGKALDDSSDTVGPEWMDSFDELVQHSGAENIRVLLRVQALDTTKLVPGVRMWLSHGVAGIYLARGSATPDQYSEAEKILQKLVASAPGNRVLLTDIIGDDPAAPNTSGHRTTGRIRPRGLANVLNIDSSISSIDSLTAAALRPILERSLLRPNEVLDIELPKVQQSDVKLSNDTALLETVALTLHSTTLLPAAEMQSLMIADDHQTPSNKASTQWLADLIALHHSSATLKYGEAHVLDFDAQNALAWVVHTPPDMRSSAPVLVVCNFGAQPVQLLLSAALARAGISATFVRPLLSSQPGPGFEELKMLKIPAFGVYIGELRR